MSGLFSRFWNLCVPPVPHAVRDELTLLQYQRLQSQIPLLYIVLGAVVLTAATYLPAPLQGRISLFLPLTIFIACVARCLVWLRRRDHVVSVEAARKLIRTTIVVSTLLAMVCSYWCVTTWQGAAHASRDVYAIFMAMGTLSTAYCLSHMRLGAVLNLIIGLAPISIALFLSGDPMNRGAAASLMVASGFLIRMIYQQHQHLVALLLLQQRMEELAYTDSLTGLLNRRAFYDRLAAEAALATSSQPLGVILIDLDGFKPVNDRFGHAVGDALLQRVAQRLSSQCADGIDVARLGGDEFALLVPARVGLAVPDVSQRVLAGLILPFEVDGARVRVGASAGHACWPADGNTIEELMVSADMALYIAKGGSRGRSRTQPVRKALVIG